MTIIEIDPTTKSEHSDYAAVLSHYEGLWRDAESDMDMSLPLIGRLQFLLPAPATVIDLGCGIGDISLPLANVGYDVTAVDGTFSAIDRLKQRAETMKLNVTTRTADVRDELKTGSSYDIAINMFLMHHLRRVDALTLQQSTRENTVPGGINVITTFSQNGDFYKQNPNSGYYFPETLQELICPYVEEGWETLGNGQETVSKPGSLLMNQVLRCMVRKPI